MSSVKFLCEGYGINTMPNIRTEHMRAYVGYPSNSILLLPWGYDVILLL